jgi:hypothetical protein
MNVKFERSFAYDVMKFDGNFSGFKSFLDYPHVPYTYKHDTTKRMKVWERGDKSDDAIPLPTLDQLMEQWDWHKWFISISRFEEDKSAPFEVVVTSTSTDTVGTSFMDDSLLVSMKKAIAWQKGYKWFRKAQMFVKQED